MTQAISHFSRHDDARYNPQSTEEKKYTGSSTDTAEKKIKKFYCQTQCYLIIAAIVIFVATNFESWVKNEVDQSESTETSGVSSLEGADIE